MEHNARVASEIRRATPSVLYRGVEGSKASGEAFESFAVLNGPTKEDLRGIRLLNYYGVSAFSSAESVRQRVSTKSRFVAVLDPSQAPGVLVIQTGGEGSEHYVLLGDRQDMLDMVTHLEPRDIA
jgi:hypothetical protein